MAKNKQEYQLLNDYLSIVNTKKPLGSELSLQLATTMTILNVDDDADDREIFLDAVKEISPSIVCLTARNGIEAQKLWDSDSNFPHLDLVFLDINMPKMSGMSLLEVMKRDSRFDQVPIYMRSTTCDEREISNIGLLGATYIEKQSQFSDIVASLSSIIHTADSLIDVGKTR